MAYSRVVTRQPSLLNSLQFKPRVYSQTTAIMPSFIHHSSVARTPAFLYSCSHYGNG